MIVRTLIRKATVDDAAAIASIHVRTWQAAYVGILPAAYLANLSEGKRAQGWGRAISVGRSTILVAEENGVVTGWAAGGASRDADGAGVAEVHAIYVNPACWSRGYGRELMGKMEEALPASTSVTLWVLRDNQRAIRFYEKAGYRPDGAQKEIQLGGIGLTEIRLRKARPDHVLHR